MRNARHAEPKSAQEHARHLAGGPKAPYLRSNFAIRGNYSQSADWVAVHAVTAKPVSPT